MSKKVCGSGLSTNEPRKVYVSKYALTEGIRLCEARAISDGGYAYVNWPGTSLDVQCRPNEWHETLDAAQASAQKMVAAKIKSLDKQRVKLEKIAKEGAKVVSS